MKSETYTQIQSTMKDDDGKRWMSDIQLAGVVEYLFGKPFLGDLTELSDAQGVKLLRQLQTSRAAWQAQRKVNSANRKRTKRKVAAALNGDAA